MRRWLRILNPLIAIWNLFKWQAHVETYRGHTYEPYDFGRDTRFF